MISRDMVSAGDQSQKPGWVKKFCPTTSHRNYPSGPNFPDRTTSDNLSTPIDIAQISPADDKQNGSQGR